MVVSLAFLAHAISVANGKKPSAASPTAAAAPASGEAGAEEGGLAQYGQGLDASLLGAGDHEDTRLPGWESTGEGAAASAAAQDAVDRCKRILANDAENIPFGLILAMASLLACSQPVYYKFDAKFNVYTALLATFTFARVAHTIAYARGLSTIRSIAWALGVLANLGQCILACTAAFVSVRSLFPPVSGLPPSYIEPIIKELTKYIADVHHALQACVAATVLLYFKFLASTVWLGISKGKAGLRAPEDAQASASSVTAALTADRAQRIVNNDLENLTWGLLLIWLSWFGVYYSSKDYSQRNREAKAIMAFVAVFLVARLAHTATYISSLSKPRSLAWITGVLATIVLIVIGLIGIFSSHAEMQKYVSTQALQALYVGIVLAWIKFFVSSLQLGGAKMKAGMRAPEDTYQNTNPSPDAVAACGRAQAVVDSDLNLLVLTAVVALGGVFTFSTFTSHTAEAHLRAQASLFILFVLSRVVQSVGATKGLAPVESIASMASTLFGALVGINIMFAFS